MYLTMIHWKSADIFMHMKLAVAKGILAQKCNTFLRRFISRSFKNKSGQGRQSRGGWGATPPPEFWVRKLRGGGGLNPP